MSYILAFFNQDSTTSKSTPVTVHGNKWSHKLTCYTMIYRDLKPVYGYINLMCENINAINKNTGILSVIKKIVCK
jgi:hypothetical protein